MSYVAERALIGSTVEWTQDLKPMPGNGYYSDTRAFDMSLVTRERGVVQGLYRTLLGAWIALVEHNGRLRELPVVNLTLVGRAES